MRVLLKQVCSSNSVPILHPLTLSSVLCHIGTLDLSGIVAQHSTEGINLFALYLPACSNLYEKFVRINKLFVAATASRERVI